MSKFVQTSTQSVPSERYETKERKKETDRRKERQTDRQTDRQKQREEGRKKTHKHSHHSDENIDFYTHLVTASHLGDGGNAVRYSLIVNCSNT